MQLRNGGFINTEAFGEGNGGEIVIYSNSLTLVDKSSINANTVAGRGGNTSLVNEFLMLRNDSSITTNAGSIANGGNINLDTTNLLVLEDSKITANAVQGQGGNIFITAQGIFLSPDSSITASSQFGVDGLVTINSPNPDNSVTLIELPSNWSDSSQQITRVCGEEKNNSLVVTGRGGLPANPEQIVNSDSILEDLGVFPAATNTTLTSPISTPSPTPASSVPIVEANSWIVNEQGNVELVAVIDPQDTQHHFLLAHCAG